MIRAERCHRRKLAPLIRSVRAVRQAFPDLSPGDVVVTGDIPLAARCIEAGAEVIKPDGSRLSNDNIGQVLASRDLMADLRAADPFRQGSGKGFGKADRSRFLEGLDRAVRDAQPRKNL